MSQQEKVYEDINVIKKNVQGGKTFGQKLSNFEKELDQIGDEYRAGNSDASAEDIAKYKQTFILYDRDQSGDIDLNELKYMMEKLGQPKTHLELKKMISQVDTVGQGTIYYKDFLTMMLGPSSNSILKKILMFESLSKPQDDPKTKGPAPKKSFADLP